MRSQSPPRHPTGDGMTGTGRPARDGIGQPGYGTRTDPPQADPWVRGGGWVGGFYGSRRGSRSAFPWAGAILVVLGVAFLVHEAEPALDGWGLVTITLGGVFFVAWATGRSWIALWPGVLLLGYGAARVLVGLGVLAGPGWTTVGIGLGFVAGWLALRGRGHVGSWPLVIAGLCVLVGAADLATEVPALLGIEAYVPPLVVVVLGLGLIVLGRRRSRAL